MAMAAKMPMIATTIINSIRVKPFCTVFSISNSPTWAIGSLRRERLHVRQQQGLCQAPHGVAKLLTGRGLHCDAVDIVKWKVSDKNAALCHLLTLAVNLRRSSTTGAA